MKWEHSTPWQSLGSFFPKASWRLALVWDCTVGLREDAEFRRCMWEIKFCHAIVIFWNITWKQFFSSWTILYFIKSLVLFHFKTYLIRRYLQYYLPNSCLLPLPVLWNLGVCQTQTAVPLSFLCSVCLEWTLRVKTRLCWSCRGRISAAHNECLNCSHLRGICRCQVRTHPHVSIRRKGMQRMGLQPAARLKRGWFPSLSCKIEHHEMLVNTCKFCAPSDTAWHSRLQRLMGKPEITFHHCSTHGRMIVWLFPTFREDNGIRTGREKWHAS